MPIEDSTLDYMNDYSHKMWHPNDIMVKIDILRLTLTVYVSLYINPNIYKSVTVLILLFIEVGCVQIMMSVFAVTVVVHITSSDKVRILENVPTKLMHWFCSRNRRVISLCGTIF